MPAVNIGTSVSRIGAKTQIPSYRSVTSALKLTYSQFEELESFSSFSTRLDHRTQKTLDRGRRIRAILNQPQFSPVEVTEQIGVLLAVTKGLLDKIDLDKISKAEDIIREQVRLDQDFRSALTQDKAIDAVDEAAFLKKMKDILDKEFNL